MSARKMNAALRTRPPLRKRRYPIRPISRPPVSQGEPQPVSAPEPAIPGYPAKIVNRILWNERGGEIDEVVISNCAVHIEQMSDNCWWIGITRSDGGYWAGNFHTKRKMTFTEQEMDGFEWDDEDAHAG